jgi:hypothetical protein
LLQFNSYVGKVKGDIEHSVKKVIASPWIERLGRIGYAAKGAVYIIVGWLATLAALRRGGKTTSSHGALLEILLQPSGPVLLFAVSIGLFGYVVWRFVQAITDAEGKGRDAKGIITRIGYTVSGFIYGGLAVTALQLALGWETGNKANSSRHWTARLMLLPQGDWLVALIGAGIIGFGCYQIYAGYKYKLPEYPDTSTMGRAGQTLVRRSSRLGLVARGVVFNIIGVFLIRAAFNHNPNEVRGLGGALRTLQQQPFGPVVLGIVAVGLIAYGFYMLMLARYRRISTR